MESVMYVPFYPYPQTPLPYDPRISRGFRPRPIHDPFDPDPDGPWEARGALPTQLSPRDFSTSNSAALSDGAQYRENAIIGQLRICSRGLKTVGEQLQQAKDDKQRTDAAINGLALISYCTGILAAEGYVLPTNFFPKTDASRGGNACKEAGEWIDKMVETYGNSGSRGAGADIGEGIDKISSCAGEVIDKIRR
jgi:hypothetical protein